MRDDVAVDLENGGAFRIVQPNFDLVRTVTLGCVRLQAQHQVHLQMDSRELSDIHAIENAENVQLAVTGDVGVVRQHCEFDLHATSGSTGNRQPRKMYEP